MNISQIKEIIKNQNIKYLQMQFVNINGQLHSVEKPITQLEKIIQGEIMIDGSSIKGYTDIKTSDLFLLPDWDTFLVLDFIDEINQDYKVARVICSIIGKDGKQFNGDSRTLLSKMEKNYNKKGYTFGAAFEVEFFLLNRTNNQYTPSDYGGYFDVAPADTNSNLKRYIVDVLQKHGFEIEAFHKEVAPGQHEINYKYSSLVQAADQVLTFKWIVKTIANKHNLVATFMPKPFKGINGSGMHTNISIFKDDKNLFYRNSSSDMTIEHKKFVSGLIRRAREIAVITNPTVNSYKRLIPGFEAPNCIAWSDSNRSAMFRIPSSIGDSTRIEQRNVDAMANPYLVLSLIFEAGFEGLNSNLKPFEPVYDDLFKKTKEELSNMNVDLLPETLGEAISIASKSSFVKKTLGDHIFNKFISIKSNEWDEYRQVVHQWEIDKYINY